MLFRGRQPEASIWRRFRASSDGFTFSEDDGIYTAHVSVKLANVPSGLKFYEPFDKLDLTMTRSTSIAIGPWTAKDPAQVESKIAGSAAFFPAGKLAEVSPLVDAAVTIIEYASMTCPHCRNFPKS